MFNMENIFWLLEYITNLLKLMNKMPSASSFYKSVQSSLEGSRAQEKKWMHRKCHACVYWAKLNWNCWQLQMKHFLFASHMFIKYWTINSSALYRMPAWLLLTWWNASLPGSASWRWAARLHPQVFAALPWLLLHAQKGPAINPQTFYSSQDVSFFALCCGSLNLSHSVLSVKADQIICMCVHSPGWNLCHVWDQACFKRTARLGSVQGDPALSQFPVLG